MQHLNWLLLSERGAVVLETSQDRVSCLRKVNTSRSCGEACVSNRRSKRVINSDGS